MEPGRACGAGTFARRAATPPGACSFRAFSEEAFSPALLVQLERDQRRLRRAARYHTMSRLTIVTTTLRIVK
jgi:hypothetical protein